MYIFPLISTVVSLVFAVMLGRQYATKRRPFQLAWAIAMGLYGLASVAEAIGQISGWNNLLVKIYYICGALLLVGFLALGTLYIQKPKVVSWLVLISGIMAMLGVFFSSYFDKTASNPEKLVAIVVFEVILIELMILAWVFKERFSTIWLGHLVIGGTAGTILATLAEVDGDILIDQVSNNKLPSEAIIKSLLLQNATLSINAIGGLILILGAVYSGWMLWRKNIMREIAIGTIVIGIGATFPFVAGVLAGVLGVVGQAEKSIFLTIGIIIMFFGFLQTGRSKPPAKKESSPAEKVEAPA